MKKQELWLLINTLILLLVAIGLIIVYNNAVVKTPEDRLFGRIVSLENEAIVEALPNTNSYAIVHLSYDAVTASGETIGKVYNLKIKNGYNFSSDESFGEIELLVGIDGDDLINVEIITLKQSSWTVKGIQRFVYDRYQDVLIAQVENVPSYDAADPDAGATATDSTGAIRDLVKKAVQMHFGTFVDDPYIEFFGEDYVLTEDTTFSGTLVTHKYTVEGQGTIYLVTGTGEYYDGNEASITLHVLLDSDGEILALLLPDDGYNHTKGFRSRNDAYLAAFIGLTLDDVEQVVNDNDDLTTGATNSKTLIETLLRALVSEVTA